MMRRLVVLLPLLLLTVFVSVGQAQDEVEQLRDLIDRGYYFSAAQVTGPDLVLRYPENAEAHYWYAFALYLTGDTATARSELDRAFALTSEVPPHFVYLNGLLRAAEGDREGALSSLRNAFERTQEYRYAMDWGRIAWQIGAYQEALDAYRAAATTERGQLEPWPHLNIGRLLAFLGRFDEAIAAFDRAIDVYEASAPDLGTAAGDPRPSPAYVEAFYRLGEIYEQKADLQRAIDNYQAALTGDPNYTPAMQALERLASAGAP